ncbi:MAG: response regulator transcription factor [Lachnospiraceae bacterium]|nr:response regulator transcription factor [Lachnospiraceae bacterium]MBR1651408.1 response regulator transcription factor [Lachnospiraceae bacterium]
MSYKILIADDEAEIRSLIRLYLENESYEVLEAGNGLEALALFNKEHPDMCILDIMMPEMDGYGVLKKIRETSNIPVLILSAKDEYSEKILGLNLGADDYISKPFNPLEIAARVASQMRRYYKLGSGENRQPSTITFGDLTLDCDGCTLIRGDEKIELTTVEFKIMELFMGHPGKVFTKQQIYEHAWGEDYIIADNNIMVSISKLRTKLSDDPSKYIKTLRGLGYKLG